MVSFKYKLFNLIALRGSLYTELVMFDSDIEQKIVDFVKKSPIGVTSSELAKYLDVNRMTLAKYLEIIKARALLDFKQLGMAKLWYIPMNINKEKFLENVVLDIVENLDKGDPKAIIHEVSIKIAKQIEQIYKQFYNVQKLSVDQIADAIIDVETKIGGEFKVVEKRSDKIILRVDKCPFTAKVKQAPLLCTFTSNIIGTIAANNSGYSKVHLRRTIAGGDQGCYIVAYLKKTKESEKIIQS